MIAAGACGCGDCRDETWHGHTGDAKPEHADECQNLEDEERADALRATQARECGEREHRSADGQRCGSSEADHTVVADEDAGRGEAMDGEERSHHGEGRSDQHDPAVLTPHADHGECQGRHRSHHRAEPHPVPDRL